MIYSQQTDLFEKRGQPSIAMETIISTVSAGIERGTAVIGAAIDDINYGPSQAEATPDR